MNSTTVFQMAAICVLATCPLRAQFVLGGVINGAQTPKGTVFLTFDDGLDEAGPDGLSQFEKVAAYLHGPIHLSKELASPTPLSIRATFAVVTCHFVGQDKAAPNSSMCYGYGDRPESVATNVAALGHDLINHSVNHIPLTTIADPADILYEVAHAQLQLDKLQGNSPRLFRAPGLAFSDSVAAVLNADPYVGQLIGPIDADVGGAFQYDGTSIGGDWDCFADGMSVETCGDLYVAGIQAAKHGVVVLLHVRTELMTGADGNEFPLKLARYIIEHLGPGYNYQPLDAIPGVLGNIQAQVKPVGAEFGPSDGQGVVVAGAIAGSGKPAGICKARSGAVWCKNSDGQGGFSAAAPWLTISDSTWFVEYGSKFWLADVNGDGRADLIFPAQKSLWVAFNNGQGSFYPPVEYYCGSIPNLAYIRFGYVNADPLADMVVWTPDLAAPQVFFNNGVRFVPPAATPAQVTPTAALETELLTMQLIDLNGDGLDDLIVRGATQVECALNTGSGFAALTACSTEGGQFSNGQGWSSADYASTFAAAHINGPALVGGLPCGLIFAPIIKNGASVSISDRYRYLCNDCFTNAADPAWQPQQRASQILWADFDASGNDSPLLVRADGLYLGLTRITP